MRMLSSIERLNRPASWNTVAIEWRSEFRVTVRVSMPSIRMRAGLRVVDALQEVDQRRLAGAGRADDGDRLAGLTSK